MQRNMRMLTKDVLSTSTCTFIQTATMNAMMRKPWQPKPGVLCDLQRPENHWYIHGTTHATHVAGALCRTERRHHNEQTVEVLQLRPCRT